MITLLRKRDDSERQNEPEDGTTTDGEIRDHRRGGDGTGRAVSRQRSYLEIVWSLGTEAEGLQTEADTLLAVPILILHLAFLQTRTNDDHGSDQEVKL